MSRVTVKIRNPWTPHQVLAQVNAVTDSLRYGFVLDRASRAIFSISRGDPLFSENLGLLDIGSMVSLERVDDDALPWVGYVTFMHIDKTAPAGSFVCDDFAGSIYMKARTPKNWAELDQAAGLHIQNTFRDADARQNPPVMTRLDMDGGLGPHVAYTPRAEPLLDMLRTMSRLGWEWAVHPHGLKGGPLQMHLQWAGQVGFDRSTEMIFTEGAHFENAKLHKSADGHFSNALAVGGTGDFGARDAAQANAAGSGSDLELITGTAFEKAPPTSPALAGTRTLIEPSVTGTDALGSMARRLHTAPEHIRERLTFQLVESAIDMEKIELGSYYGVRFSDLELGLGYERVVRCMALNCDESGVLEMIAEAQ